MPQSSNKSNKTNKSSKPTQPNILVIWGDDIFTIDDALAKMQESGGG